MKNKKKNVSDYTKCQDDLKAAFVSLIYKARKKKELSVRDLAKISDVSHTVIYELENNNSLPKFEILNKLANSLDYNIEIKRFTSDEDLETVMLCYAPKNTTEQEIVKSGVLQKYTPYKNQSLQDVLRKKGLYANEIKEIEDFINFKISKHKN